jgi:8-oxo-dGTP diphosphatase
MLVCTFEDGNKASLRHVTVDCIVVKDGNILLGKRSKGLLEAGKWCLLGGYVNRDETTGEAAIREVMEESGWTIRDLFLLRVNDNPNRPHEDRQNIDFVYVASGVKKTGEKDWENEDVRWFPLDKLPSADKMAFDHLDSIELYKNYRTGTFPAPVIDKPERAAMRTIHRDCVVGIILSSDGKILFGKKDPRAGGVYPDCWHLPGGGIEPGESQHEALRREIKEETGVDIAPYSPDLADGEGYGETEKLDKATDEKVLCKMNFYTYKVQLPLPAASISTALNSDLVEITWANLSELANYQLTPPSVQLFTKLGYLT